MVNSIAVPQNNLASFLQAIRKYPMLTVEEEQKLARRWREENDREALDRLVGSHLRLVVKIARGYAGYGLPMADLISEGNVGLTQAAHRFEADRGFRFATYAMWWIRAAIQEYILHSWSLVKMGTTAAQKKLFFGLRKAKEQISAVEEGDLGPDNVRRIAEALDVPEADVVSMNRRMGARDQSLNVTIRDEGEIEWQDWLVDDTQDQESALVQSDELDKRRAMLEQGMQALNDRERHILYNRRLRDDPMTLEDLSHHYGISRERVRQIEVRAFEKLQKAVINQNQALEQAA
jgi:RNA polymerase sigma-32 factor